MVEFDSVYPSNLWESFLFVLVIGLGAILSLGVQHFFMYVLLKPEKVATDAANRVGAPAEAWDYKRLGHLGTGLQRWVGAIEIILYSTSIVFGFPQFIAVWLGTKYVAFYRTWAREPVGRTFYNRSLFGSGLNILLGAATGGAALLAIRHARHFAAVHGDGMRDTVTASVARGFPAVALYAFFFSVSFVLCNSILGDFEWFRSDKRWWVRSLLRVALFVALFVVIMIVPFVRNLLSEFIGWLLQRG
jgi:hypothetical protein